jgi:hypothetical protein
MKQCSAGVSAGVCIESLNPGLAQFSVFVRLTTYGHLNGLVEHSVFQVRSIIASQMGNADLHFCAAFVNFPMAFSPAGVSYD